MISARTSALCLNRIIDRHLIVPTRTAHCNGIGAASLALPLGRYQAFTAFPWRLRLNPLCLQLFRWRWWLPWGYSHTKRFTWCYIPLHQGLGWDWSVHGSIIRLDWQPILLSLAVACWAGFDITYACLDINSIESRAIFHSAALALKALFF